jgi:phosphatidylglycerol lysyltransferase
MLANVWSRRSTAGVERRTRVLRRVLFWMIIVSTVWLATTHGAAVSQIAVEARHAAWQWFALAVVLQAGYYALRVAWYRAAFGVVGVRRSFRELVPLVFGAVYLSTVVPGAGASGRSLLARDAVESGYPADRALQMPVVARLTDFTGFATVMFAGFWYLISLDSVHLYEVGSSLIVLGTILVLGASLALATLRPQLFLRLLAPAEKVARALPFVGGHLAPEGWSDRVVTGYGLAGQTIISRPGAVFVALAASIAAYAVDLLSFIAVGFAFGWPALGALIAAFAVGMLTWLVSVVPQGIGVVEAVIALMLSSFGASAPTAILIALGFRVLTYWIPLVLGALLVRRVPTFSTLRTEAAEVFPVRLAAVVTFAVGAMNLLSAMTPAAVTRLRLLEQVLPLQSQYGRLSAALAGIALMALARGLWRRKRLAWMATIAVLAISIASHLLKGLDFEEALISLALLVFLLFRQSEFRARSDAPSIAQGMRVLAAAFAITLAYGTLGFFLLDRQFGVTFTFWPAVRQTLVMYTQFYNPGVVPRTLIAEFFVGSIYVVGAATIGFALIMLLRPVLVRRGATPGEMKQARSIVEHYGATPLAVIALLPDKSLHLTAGGSLIAYRLVGDTAVVLGDPVGPPDDASASVCEMLEVCENNGWNPAFYQTRAELLDVYRAAGLAAIRIGHEAIVDVPEFSLSGKRYRVERNLVNRLTNEGYSAGFRAAPQSPGMLRELRDVSDAWLAEGGGSEMGFSLGWFDDDYLRECGIMVIEGPQGEVEAFANVIREPAINQASVDLMRYRPSAPDGVMDFAFIRLLEWAREDRLETFNLGFAALSGLGEQEDPAVERFLRLAYEYGSRFYSFKGLYRFKQKFRPDWEPRYLIYPDSAMLPGVLAAIVRANTGRGDVSDLARELTGRVMNTKAPH